MKISFTQITALLFAISVVFTSGVLDQISPIIVPIILNTSYALNAASKNISVRNNDFLYSQSAIIISSKNYLRMFFLVVTYKLVDRVPLFTLIIATLASMFGATFIYLFADTFWKLLAARMVDSVQGALSGTVSVKVASQLFPTDKYSKKWSIFAFGITKTFFITGDIVGPSFGGYILSYYNRRTVFEWLLLICAVPTVSICLTWILKKRELLKKVSRISKHQSNENTQLISIKEMSNNDKHSNKSNQNMNRNTKLRDNGKVLVSDASCFSKYSFVLLGPINIFFDAATESGKASSFSIWLADQFHIDSVIISNIWLISGLGGILVWIVIPVLPNWKWLTFVNLLSIGSSYSILIVLDPFYFSLVKKEHGEHYVGRASAYYGFCYAFFNVVLANASGFLSGLIGYANFSYIIGTVMICISFINLLFKNQCAVIFEDKQSAVNQDET